MHNSTGKNSWALLMRPPKSAKRAQRRKQGWMNLQRSTKAEHIQKQWSSASTIWEVMHNWIGKKNRWALTNRASRICKTKVCSTKEAKAKWICNEPLKLNVSAKGNWSTRVILKHHLWCRFLRSHGQLDQETNWAHANKATRICKVKYICSKNEARPNESAMVC